MSTAQQVIDEIGALVEEQMVQESSGYDWNLNQPRCRCTASWHGLPTRRCPGSDSEGPMVRREVRSRNEFDVEAYAVAFQEMRRAVLAEWERVSVSLADAWEALRSQIGALYPDAVHAADREDGRPALPTAARTPPMWAVDATRTRRSRHL